MAHYTGLTLLIPLLLLSQSVPSNAQISLWKIGGSGFSWAENDTTRLFIDFSSTPGSIQPVYFNPRENAFLHIGNWAFWRDPSDRIFDYQDGEMPRMWKWNNGIPDPSENGSRLLDSDPITYNPPSSDDIERETFTMDVAVPVPAVAFAFIPPSEGFRSNGTPLETDFVPAYLVTASVGPEPPVLEGNVQALSTVLADVSQNFSPQVRIDFSRQYLRFFRYRRIFSDLDASASDALALLGSISEFQLFAQGVPQRAIYKTKITHLEQPLNFGRLFWQATRYRVVDGQPVAMPEADAQLRVEVRTGRDDDPAVYHGYMDTGLERVVSRDYYENQLRTRFLRIHAQADLSERQPKPGVRASITYDSDNWTFWSAPFTEPGQPINLQSGSYIQLRISLESNSFDDFVRLDSLWFETAPLLAADVRGEIARMDDVQPKSGATEVALGEETQFVYDLRADFSGVDAAGFDLLRLRTGNRTTLHSLHMGSPLVEVAQSDVIDEGDGLLIRLPERITRANNPPMRLAFSTEVFEFAKTFQSEVLDSERDVLPQPVSGGDVSDELGTNSLRVIGNANASPDFVQGLSFASAIFTPNGDGINDQLRINYSLFRLPTAVPVALDIYRLDGQRVASVEYSEQRAGPQSIGWDGRDEAGLLLPPGTYLATVRPLADFATSARLYPIAIAY